MRFNGMQRISEYTQSLSAVSRARYESKVTSTGLNTDPYAIDDSQWSTSPEAVPDLTWSDMVLHMISTPSPYTKEEIKASDSTTVIILIYHSNLGLEGDVRWK